MVRTGGVLDVRWWDSGNGTVRGGGDDREGSVLVRVVLLTGKRIRKVEIWRERKIRDRFGVQLRNGWGVTFLCVLVHLTD